MTAECGISHTHNMHTELLHYKILSNTIKISYTVSLNILKNNEFINV